MGVEVGVGVGVGADSGVGVSVGASVGVGVVVARSAVGTPVEIVGISVGSAVDVDGSSPGATVDVEGSAVGTAVGVNGTSAEFSFDSALSASGGSTNVIADSGVAGGIVSQASVPFSFASPGGNCSCLIHDEKNSTVTTQAASSSTPAATPKTRPNRNCG